MLIKLGGGTRYGNHNPNTCRSSCLPADATPMAADHVKYRYAHEIEDWSLASLLVYCSRILVY